MYMTSHFWLVVSRECTNIVIITLYYFCMYAQFFFFNQHLLILITAFNLYTICTIFCTNVYTQIYE